MENLSQKSTPSGLQFKADGVVYEFVVNKFFVPGFGEFTPKTALEEEEVLAYLVCEKSQVIAKVILNEKHFADASSEIDSLINDVKVDVPVTNEITQSKSNSLPVIPNSTETLNGENKKDGNQTEGGQS